MADIPLYNTGYSLEGQILDWRNSLPSSRRQVFAGLFDVLVHHDDADAARWMSVRWMSVRWADFQEELEAMAASEVEDNHDTTP